jgi:hypothetical protein
MTSNFFFHPSLWLLVFGSGILDPGWVKNRIRDKHPGSATLITYIQQSNGKTERCRGAKPKHANERTPGFAGANRNTCLVLILRVPHNED